MAESKFIKIKCNKCNNEQVSFGKTSSDVKCLVCNEPLIKSTGGKGQVNTKIVEVLN